MRRVWNVAVPVVANVLAHSAGEAVQILAEALRKEGFEACTDEQATGVKGAFEAEEGTGFDFG